MSNGIPPQSNPLIPIAGPLMTLGGICLAILGQRMLGISLLSIAVLAALQDAVVKEEVRQVKAESEFWSNRSPRDASLLALLGVADRLLDDPYAAEVQYKRAIDLNPSYANAYNYWGFDLGRWRIRPKWAETAKEK